MQSNACLVVTTALVCSVKYLTFDSTELLDPSKFLKFSVKLNYSGMPEETQILSWKEAVSDYAWYSLLCLI